MTVPTGHPDYQAYANWRGSVLTSGTAVYANGNTQLGPYTVPNFASIVVLASSSTDLVTVEFKFYSDASMAVLMNIIDLELSVNVKTNVTLPVYGSTFTATVQNTSGGNASVALNILPSNIATPKPAYQTVANRIAQLTISVPASTTNVYQMPYAQPGMASLYVRPADATGKLDFRVSPGSPAALHNRAFQVTAPVTETRALAAVDERPHNLLVINNDAGAAHTFDATLTIVGGF